MINGLKNWETKDWIVKLQWQILTHKAIIDASNKIIEEMIVLSQERKLLHQTLTSEEAERLNKARTKLNYHEKEKVKKQRLILEIRKERTDMTAVIQHNQN